KLKKVCNQNAPKAADKCVKTSEGNKNKDADGQRGMSRITQRVVQQNMSANTKLQNASLGNHRPQYDGDNVHHRPRHPSQDEAVHQQSEVNSFEAAQKRSRFAAIANFNQLYIRQNLRPPPIARKEEDGRHAAQAQAPPYPVTRDTLRRYQPAH